MVDSTGWPVFVEDVRAETVRRSALGDAADSGWCASHSRYFWGFRLHAIFAPGNKGYAGRASATAAADLDATIVRPKRRDEPG